MTRQISTGSQFVSSEVNVEQGFEKNLGQIYDESGKFRDDVHFVAKFSEANVFLTENGVVFYFKKVTPSEYEKILANKIPNPYSDREWENIQKKCAEGNELGDMFKAKSEAYRIDITFPDANFDNPIGCDEKIEKRHYYNPHNPDGLRNVPIFEKVRYEDVYQGVDMVFYFHDGILKYDFEIAPHADPSKIKIVYKGHKSIDIDDN
jgi:hypothetical protein